MICISVTPESRQLAKVDILNASRQCDLVEVCLDRLLKEPDFKDLTEGAKKPLLFSCRRQQDGGAFKGTEEERMGLLRQAIIAGPAYVELDEEIAKKIPRFGKVQRVISYTSLDRPLTDIEEAFTSAGVLQADVIKFTWPTEYLEAAWPLLAAVSQKRSIPVVGMGLGKSGITFSLLGRKYGSPWIYAALEQGMEAFAGQPTVSELDEIYRWRAIGPKTKFVGIAGIGRAASVAASVLNAGFDQLDLNTRCLPLDFKTTEPLPKMLDILKVPAMIATGHMGRKSLGLSHQQDEVAKGAQFADLFLKQPDGWQAYNLIWKTALRSLEEALGRTTPEDRPLDRRNVMILGNGGLAHAIALGIKKRNGLVSICGAEDEEAQNIARHVDARFVPLGSLYDTLFDVLVVTVPNFDLGHRKTPINPTIVRPGMAVLDLSALPDETPLAEEARLRGGKVVEVGKLYGEYLASLFKSFTGQELPQGEG